MVADEADDHALAPARRPASARGSGRRRPGRRNRPGARRPRSGRPWRRARRRGPPESPSGRWRCAGSDPGRPRCASRGSASTQATAANAGTVASWRVGAPGPVGGARRRHVGQPLDHVGVRLERLAHVGGERHHLAVIHRRRAAGPAPWRAIARARTTTRRRRWSPSSASAARRPPARRGARRRGARRAGPRRARWRRAATGAGMPANGSQARPPAATRPESRAAPPARSTAATNAFEASRSRGDPLRSGMNSPTRADEKHLGRGVVDPAVARDELPEHQPGSGRDHGRLVDEEADQGQEQDDEAGESGADLAPAREADDAERAAQERAAARHGAGGEQLRTERPGVHERGDRNPHPGRRRDSRREPCPGHRRPDRALSLHRVFRPHRQAGTSLGSALSGSRLNGGQATRTGSDGLLH